MKKKIFVLLFLIMIVLTSCTKKETITDSLKFKEEYERLNGQKDSDGNDLVDLDIDEDNNVVYLTIESLIKKLEDKETFIVYFGYSSSNECRLVLPNLLKVAYRHGLDKLYYLDTTSIDDKDKFAIIEDKLKEVLEENDSSESIKVPSIIAIKDGLPIMLTHGLSDYNDFENITLDDKLDKEIYNNIVEVIDSIVDSSSCNEDKVGC